MIKEEIRELLLKRLSNRELYPMKEKTAYLLGYLQALKDMYEIDSDTYFEWLEELRYD